MAKEQIGEGLDAPIPDVVEPLVGYRAWQWDDRGLKSDRGTRWTPGEALKAECGRAGNYPYLTYLSHADRWDEEIEEPTHPDTCPSHPQDIARHGAHGCGIYAYATIEDAWRNLGERAGNPNTIIGEVELWGTVWPHEKGYRAEHAKPRAFYRRASNEPSPMATVMKKWEHAMLHGTSPTAGDPAPEPTTPFWGDPIELLAELFDVPVVEVMLDKDQREALVKEGRDERYSAYASQFGNIFTSSMLYGSSGKQASIVMFDDIEPAPRRPWYRKPEVYALSVGLVGSCAAYVAAWVAVSPLAAVPFAIPAGISASHIYGEITHG